MTIEFLYWAPQEDKPSEPAGHVGLRINNAIYTFWPIVARPDDTAGPVPSVINKNEPLEFFVAGLRQLALNDLIAAKKRLPSGIQTYQIIFEHFDVIKSSSDLEIADFFNVIDSDPDPQKQVLGDQRQTVIDASIALAKWVRDRDVTVESICDVGQPTEYMVLEFLNESLITRRLAELQALGDNLRWYAKVGAKTDTALNAGVPMWVPSLFAATMSGLRYYVPEQVRHNCASFILDLLTAGDTEGQLSHFDESPYIAPALQKTIRLNAASKGQVADPADIASAAGIRHLHWPLRLLRYGPHPITGWFGTTPEVLREAVSDSIERHEHPERFTRAGCLIC